MRDHGQPEGGSIRASDQDRNRVAEELRVHCAAGRITVDELERRLEAVMVAETIHEIASLVYDLPAIPPSQPSAERPRKVRVGRPGVRPFTQRMIVPASADRTRAVALDTIAPGLNGLGYELVRQSPGELHFTRGSRERIVVALEPRGSGETLVIIHGRAPWTVRKRLAKLQSG